MDKQKRKQLNKRLRNASDMQAKLQASREVLACIPEMHTVSFKIDTCDRTRPCNQTFCEYCSGARRDRFIKHPHREQVVPVSRKNAGRGGQRNFRRRGGEWLSEPFRDKSLDTVFPVTINLCAVALQADGKEVSQRVRRRLRRICKQEFPNAVMRFQFDIVAKSVGDLAPELLGESLHGPCAEPVVLMFHAHGFISDPTCTSHKVRQVLQKYYPGSKRICISKHTPISYDEYGRERGGLAGFGEYASMEKTELDFPDDVASCDNVAVLEALIKFRHHWPRQSRRFTYGYRKQEEATEERPPGSNLSVAATHMSSKYPYPSREAVFGLHYASRVRNNCFTDYIAATTRNIWGFEGHTGSRLCGESCRRKPP